MSVAATSGRHPPPRPRSGVVRLAGFALLVTLTAAGTHAQADGEAREVRELLERMVRASRTLDYVGTFVYRNGSTIRSMRIIHRAGAEGSRERLVALSGAAREVIRDAERVVCILPDDRAVVITRRRPGHAYASTAFDPEVAIGSAIGELYVLTSDGTERVADRDAAVIAVRPKDPYRYGLRLAVDRETGLLLKLELLDGDSTALEQIVYTNLELPETIPDEALRPGISHDGFARYESGIPQVAGDAPDARAQEWTIGWLPAGFTMTDASYGPIQPGREAVDHRVYSDGLASLSIFIERGLDPAGPLEGLSSVGAVNAFSRVIDEYQLSVVGEVPGMAVERVAASITKR